jgi:hypothetical protein
VTRLVLCVVCRWVFVVVVVVVVVVDFVIECQVLATREKQKTRTLKCEKNSNRIHNEAINGKLGTPKK